MKKIYFIAGCQDLYGDETIRQVERDSMDMAKYLNSRINGTEIAYNSTVLDTKCAEKALAGASADDDCIGVIVWMHTFSPAKMWIKGLQKLTKPLLHLHTQYNRELPYGTIDMDFMNLNQSAHGDREFGFICARLNVAREVVAGYYKDEAVLKKISRFADVARALDYSRNLRVAMFGSNMRDVAVTDCDRVECEIHFGWNVNYYGLGDLVNLINDVTSDEVAEQMKKYAELYEMNTDDVTAVEEQAKYEIALRKFIAREEINAFTDTFQDLHGLRQLPGLSVQSIMADGIGFGAEGDVKISSLMAVLCKMAEGREGATAFIEDYTYDLSCGKELELASHMLEVSPVFASTKPKIEVHPLGIGNREAPARLVFDGISGKGIQCCVIDLGDRFRIVCADIELVKCPKEMPKLPVARVLWKILPDFATGAEKWIYAGGAHHSVVSTALTREDIALFAKLTDTEVVFIG